jgi:hypothetical protein
MDDATEIDLPESRVPCLTLDDLALADRNAVVSEGQNARWNAVYLLLLLHWLEHHYGSEMETDYGPATLEHLIDVMAEHPKSKALFKVLRRFHAENLGYLWNRPDLLAQRLRAVVVED